MAFARSIAKAVVAGFAVAAATFAACTIDVGPNDPPVTVNVEVRCVVIELPGGATKVECPEAGPEGGDGGPTG